MASFDLADTMTEPFRDLAVRSAQKLPGLAAAFLILLVGLLAARGLRAFVERGLQKAKLDERTAGVGINELLTRLGFGRSPTFIVGFVAYWFILLAFIVAAANAVDLQVVSELISRFVRFLPSVIAAVLILFGGMLFARFLSEVVGGAAAANDIRGGAVLARATTVVILVFSVLMALEQLGVQMTLVAVSIQILLASLGLAFALAFGLGARPIAEEMLRELVGRGASAKQGEPRAQASPRPVSPADAPGHSPPPPPESPEPRSPARAPAAKRADGKQADPGQLDLPTGAA